MSESLRQALVDFLNQQGEAVYPTAAITLEAAYGGTQLAFLNTFDGDWVDTCPDPQDLAQFLLEYSIV